ncbi:MAG: hypothetical protein RRA92_09465 [Gemmatimonadota bacterium]|nr:hypothetical protein [Gemmatimonadota bacterium]
MSCPLCHEALADREERALVAVSPVVYPGVAGLDVHARCLRAAREGAFEKPPPGLASALRARLRAR